MTQVVPREVTGAVAPTKVEAPLEASATEVKPATPPQDDAFAKMASLEKQKRLLDQQYKTEKKAWEQEKAQLLQKAQPDNSWKDKLKTNLVDTLAEAGLTYDEVLQTYVNHTPMDQNMKMVMAEIGRVKEEANQTKTLLEQQQKQNYEQALRQIKTEVKQLVKSSPEDFEVISSQGELAEDAVVQLIQKTYEDEGYLMDVGDAAKQVEDYMLENTLSLARLKKVQAKLTPTQVAAQAEVKITPQAKGPTTLSHTMQTQSKPLTSKERVERAILAFQGKLT